MKEAERAAAYQAAMALALELSERMPATSSYCEIVARHGERFLIPFVYGYADPDVHNLEYLSLVGGRELRKGISRLAAFSEWSGTPVESPPGPWARQLRGRNPYLINDPFEWLQHMIENEERNRSYRDALELIHAYLCWAECPLPPALAERDRLKHVQLLYPQSRPGPGRPKKIDPVTQFRRERVAWIVEFIAKSKNIGINPTRSESKKHEHSICDAVADVLGLSYSTVSKAWNNYRR